MALFRALLAPLFLVAALLTASALGSTPPPCSADEEAAYLKVTRAAPPKCVLQQFTFNVCDDDCLRSTQELMAVSPNCTLAYKSAYQSTKELLEQCEWTRKNATDKYMPLQSTGLLPCTSAQTREWSELYGIGSPVQDCVTNSTSNKTRECSDECRKILEESVNTAPACSDSTSGYWVGELQKYQLMDCILRRGESLASNDVMQSVKNGDGSFTRANTTVTTSAPPSPNNTANGSGKTTDSSTTPPTLVAPTGTPSSVATWHFLPVSVLLGASMGLCALAY